MPTGDLPDRVEGEIERHAPGFTKLIRRRHVLGPAELEARDRNLVGGAINGGTAQLHQQLLFRPMRTEVAGVLLASASAHPGGGVHGAPGAIAAHAALRAQKAPRRPSTAGTVLTRMLRSRKTDQRSR
jgi:phytoene dehydrogenase-like protein